MSRMKSERKHTPRQILMRVLSVLACAAGTGGCAYSLTMQVADSGTVLASVTWFTGLFAVVFGIAGYAVTTNPRNRKSHLKPAVACVVVLAVAVIVFEKMMLNSFQVITISLVAAAIEGVALIVAHFVFKKADPEAY
jgi:predicted membrane channel-forming protein YqfA (hemolysin III family)